MFSRRFRLAVAVLPLLVALLVSPGCKKDKNPAGCTQTVGATLANLWPNADGTAWTYALTQRWWDADFPTELYDSAAEVPPAPSLDEVIALLAGHAIGASVETVTGTWELTFDGETTTQAGVTAQHLRETLALEADPPATAAAATPRASRWSEALLARVWHARPDLRARLAERSAARADDVVIVAVEPVFLHGGAWEKTSDRIGTYGDLSRELSWVFLEGNLAPGHTFTLELLPEFASDIYLHGRILERANVTTPAGAWCTAVGCLYVVDYGLAQLTDLNGMSLGWFRVFDYGVIRYVPDVGPVRGYERSFVEPGSPPTSGVRDATLELIATTP